MSEGINAASRCTICLQVTASPCTDRDLAEGCSLWLNSRPGAEPIILRACEHCQISTTTPCTSGDAPSCHHFVDLIARVDAEAEAEIVATAPDMRTLAPTPESAAATERVHPRITRTAARLYAVVDNAGVHLNTLHEDPRMSRAIYLGMEDQVATNPQMHTLVLARFRDTAAFMHRWFAEGAEPETEPENPWRPIATAPRDGTLILLGWGAGLVAQGRYTPPGEPGAEGNFPWAFLEHDEEAGRRRMFINRSVDGLLGPSHWMPLPQSPLALRIGTEPPTLPEPEAPAGPRRRAIRV